MTIDEFSKAELRVGKVVAAERVEGSEKLLKLQLDLGPLPPSSSGQNGADAEHPESGPPSQSPGELRQILSGIAKWYAPEDLVGKNLVIIANLEPRMMMGLESQGMVLAAHGADGEAVVLMPIKDVPPGAIIT